MDFWVKDKDSEFESITKVNQNNIFFQKDMTFKLNSLKNEFDVINKVFSLEKLEQFDKLTSEMEKVVF